MKKLFFLIFFGVFSYSCFSQKTLFLAKVSNNISANQTQDYLTIYNGTNFGIGIQQNTLKGSLNVILNYQFGGSLVSNGLRPYLMNNHFLGGTVQYRFLNKDKKISPIIKLTMISELASNYRGKIINDFGPDNYPYVNWVNPSGNDDHIDYYSTDYYVSTPIVGSFTMGVDFQLIRNLNLTVELGYGFRVMKIRYKKWGANQQEPASDLSDKYSLKDVNFLHCIDFELGISYAFSFKKKEKPNPIE